MNQKERRKARKSPTKPGGSRIIDEKLTHGVGIFVTVIMRG